MYNEPNNNDVNQNEPNQTGDNGSTNTRPGENGNQTEKLFTQEEVNKIVQERLNKEKTRATPNEQDAKELELSKRESRLSCRDYLDEKGYFSELVDILDTSDIENFKAKADKLYGLVPGISKNHVRATPILAGAVPTAMGSSDDARIADAFRPKI